MIRSQQEEIKKNPLCFPEDAQQAKPAAKSAAGTAMVAGLKDLRGELSMISDSLGRMASTMQ